MKRNSDPAVTYRHTTSLVRQQALFASVISFLIFLVCYAIPDFPFDRRFLWLILGVAVMCLGTYLFLWKLLEKYYRRAITVFCFVALAVMGFVTHMSGGIVSPFVFLYFAILISEASFSGERIGCIVAAILSYLCAVLGEYSGLLPVTNPFAAKIYASPAATFWIIFSLASFMAISGFVVKIIVARLRLKVMDENNKKQAVISKLAELDACSNIGIMAHRIIHDLRGPLSSISGYVELERMRPDQDASAKAALSDLSETVANMSNALANITCFGRAAGGKKEKINMTEFFRNLVSILAFHKDAQKVQFRQNYPGEGELPVMALRQDLQQAYFNILKNAVEAVRDNAGDKIVEISMRQQPAGTLEVDVTSNGRPIPEAILAKIFQKTVTGKPDGTGVGLLITHDLLMNNDISIEAKNIEGTGVLIRTRMPLAG